VRWGPTAVSPAGPAPASLGGLSSFATIVARSWSAKNSSASADQRGDASSDDVSSSREFVASDDVMNVRACAPLSTRCPHTQHALAINTCDVQCVSLSDE